MSGVLETVRRLQGSVKSFSRSHFMFNQLLVKLAKSRVSGRSQEGEVRVTLTGLGEVQSIKINPELKGKLELITVATVEAVNDARNKMHELKKIEWEKYSQEQLKDPQDPFVKKRHASLGSPYLELRNEKPIQTDIVNKFAALVDLETDTPDYNPLPPFTYDRQIIENYEKFFNYLNEKGINLKEALEDFENIELYLDAKGISMEQFEEDMKKLFPHAHQKQETTTTTTTEEAPEKQQ
eukprot:GEZU01030516.1.p1 GENE.GEZU01030516.1~~GEZU01030516.1.p1  ORF type:complete len:253 (+),score=74.04 GEZU01030516.1:48-761(+)